MVIGLKLYFIVIVFMYLFIFLIRFSLVKPTQTPLKRLKIDSFQGFAPGPIERLTALPSLRWVLQKSVCTSNYDFLCDTANERPNNSNVAMAVEEKGECK